MWKNSLILLLVLLMVGCAVDGARQAGLKGEVESLSKRQMQGMMEFLSLDHLEGRAPGTRGGELAEEYVKSIYQLMDFEPYQGSYFQEFTLQGFTLEELQAQANGVELLLNTDVSGGHLREQESFSMSGDVVFIGFGIVSEDWDWDDYEDVSVRDKIVVVRVNEPDPSNAELFEGKALTYYGRWTYKIEEAARRRAKGILLIHNDESAGYGWNVVENSFGGELLFLPSALENDLRFRAWIREEKLREVLEAKNISLDDLYRQSESREFRPVELGFGMDLSGRVSYREAKTRNVVGVVPGSDPVLKDKAIVLTAHLDHLGMNPDLEGDQVFNGALDNTTGVAAITLAAKIFKDRQEDLRYSLIVVACEAEESGLLGSAYFAQQVDPSKVVANINLDSPSVWGKTRDFQAIGGRFSTLEDILKEILEEEGFYYSYYSQSNQGSFYRSDQFNFAKQGIPALMLSPGEDYVSGGNPKDEYHSKYHTVEDEFDPNWPLDSFVETIKITTLMIDYLNRNTPELKWKGKMTFPVDK